MEKPNSTPIPKRTGINKYKEGEIYYRVGYGDRTRYYPTIETFVFIGKNLSDEDKEDTWYFQFAASYARFGSVLKTRGGDRAVAVVTESGLKEIIGLDALISKLRDAADRRTLGLQMPA